MWENLRWKIKQRRGAGTITLISVLKPAKGRMKLRQSQTPMLQTLWWVYQGSAWEAGVSEQSGPFTWHQLSAASTPACSNPPSALAAKGCHRRLHGWVSQQSKQTDQKWISPPEISQQIKLNLPVGKAQRWKVPSPHFWELFLPTVPIPHQLPQPQR